VGYVEVVQAQHEDKRGMPCHIQELVQQLDFVCLWPHENENQPTEGETACKAYLHTQGVRCNNL
jgi:hypothetical protein